MVDVVEMVVLVVVAVMMMVGGGIGGGGSPSRDFWRTCVTPYTLINEGGVGQREL